MKYNNEAVAIRAAMRFLAMLRHRKQYLIGAVGLAGLLGALYYLTATRIYEGNATLFVTQTGSDVWNTSIAAETGQNSLMPTCERLFSSAVVLKGAIERIERLAPELRVDFAPIPRDAWEKVLRLRFNTHAVRQTNLIEVSYRSKSPRAAEAVVAAVVDSYLDFMDKNHKDVSLEIITTLDGERKQIEQQLVAKQEELREAKRVAQDLGLSEGGNVVHPAVQRVVTLNDTLVEVRTKRIELEASLAAVRMAIRNGADLRHHLLTVEPLVGRQLIMNALGLTPESSVNANEVERKLMADRAALDLAAQHYGPRHPKVIRLQQSIEYAERYLATHNEALSEQMAKLQGGALGPMLVAMIEQQLFEVQSHEAELSREYVEAEAEAVALNDRLAALKITEDEVERLGRFHRSLLDKMTSVDINQNRGDIRITVVSEPAAEDKPVSPKLAVVGLLCLVVGLGSGTGVIYVLDLLDDRFRSPEEMEEQLGAPVLTLIRRLPDLDSHGADALAVHVLPQAVESEAFRTLRTALAFSGTPSRRVAVTSCEPSDGKTTVLANLGMAFAQAGKRTLLVDADLRRPGLSRLFNCRGGNGLSRLLREGGDVGQVAASYVRTSGVSNLDVLPCGIRPTDPAELLSAPQMEDLLAWAEGVYDQVLVDCPPLLAASDATLIGRLVDGVALVVQPNKNHRRIVLRASNELVRAKVNLLGIVVNRVDDQQNSNFYQYGAGYGMGYGYGLDRGDDETDDHEPDDLETDHYNEELAAAAVQLRRAA